MGERLYRCSWCGNEKPAVAFKGRLKLVCLACTPEATQPVATNVGLVATSKVCSTCGREKLVAEFRPKAAMLDGRDTRCRWCVRVARWRSLGVIGALPTEPPASCDLCGRANSRLHMDHCHETGRFRGFICSGCNTGLGQLGDTLESVAKAMAYLQRVYDSFGTDDAADQGILERSTTVSLAWCTTTSD